MEHAVTDKVNPIGKENDNNGDVLTFNNDVYDARNKKKVGTDAGAFCFRAVVSANWLGYCIRITTGPTGTWDCTWTVFLSAGQISVNGPFFDTADSVLQITGGTGKYKGISGQMKLEAVANSNPQLYNFIYEYDFE